MKAIEIMIQLDEVGEKLPQGIRKGNHACIKTSIDEVTRGFREAIISDYPSKLLKAINNMVGLYTLITEEKPTVERMITSSQRALLNLFAELENTIPPNKEVEFLGERVPCLQSLCKELILYYYNDLAINIYSIDYYKYFKEVYRLLGYSASGDRLLDK